MIKKISSDFKIKIDDIFQDDKRDITIIDRKKLQSKTGQWFKYYKYKCNKCGFDGGYHWSIRDKEYRDELWIEESSLLKKRTGCSCCCSAPRIVVEDINSIYKTDKWLIPIINDEEFCKTHTHSCSDEIYPTCPDCRRIKNKPISINKIYCNNSIGCACSDGITYPNKFSYELLKQLNNIYKFDYIEHEYSPNWIGQKRYDNYFIYKGKEYILEMDGGFHNKDNTMSGQTKEKSKAIDNYKDEQARLHNIEVIRIDCDYKGNNRFEYIKNSILQNEKMNILFELNRLDFDICNQFSSSNLVKIACDIKRNNPSMTTIEIGNIMHYEGQTICKWLKQGNGIWCEYNSKEERNKGLNLGRERVKPIICLTNKKVFISAIECDKQSLDIFGVKIGFRYISKVCNKKQNRTKGYEFKFISDLTQQEYIKYDIENKLKELHRRELVQAS